MQRRSLILGSSHLALGEGNVIMTTPIAAYSFPGDPSGHLTSHVRIYCYLHRSCPGLDFADSALYITIAHILATFDILKARDVNGNEIEPKIGFAPGLSGYVKIDIGWLLVASRNYLPELTIKLKFSLVNSSHSSAPFNLGRLNPRL